jgi:preprotein translocase subunit SecF
MGLQDAGVLRVDTVGPQIGSELKRNGMLAAFYSFLVILIYVGIRFDYKYAPGAVLCLVHDAIVTVGVAS